MLAMAHHDTLTLVKTELRKRSGELRQIASNAGLSYDTVLRIKNGEGDPGYSKVRALAEFLGLASGRKHACKVAAQPQAEQGV